jgi:hypothetical protein
LLASVTSTISLSPEWLVDQELGIRARKPDIPQHSIVEFGELRALTGTPAPFAKNRDKRVLGLAQHANGIAAPASWIMQVDDSHVNSPNLG